MSRMSGVKLDGVNFGYETPPQARLSFLGGAGLGGAGNMVRSGEQVGDCQALGAEPCGHE
jgi:hypothetical protein